MGPNLNCALAAARLRLKTGRRRVVQLEATGDCYLFYMRFRTSKHNVPACRSPLPRGTSLINRLVQRGAVYLTPVQCFLVVSPGQGSRFFNYDVTHPHLVLEESAEPPMSDGWVRPMREAFGVRASTSAVVDLDIWNMAPTAC